MRADRLLSILLLLQVHHRITAHELAKRLEVCERTIHRDMEALGMAGIPVIAERGVGGGWGLLDEYRTNLTGMTEIEIQTLFLTTPSRLLADLGLHKASEGALLKLLASLPAMNRRDAEFANQRIHIDIAGWHNPEEAVPYLPMLQAAIWQEHKLHLIYKRGKDSVERTVDPLGLVAKGSIWYLIAAVEGQSRTYRVSRIHEAHVLEQSCIRPPDFDLAAYWTQSSTDFKESLPRYTVTVRIAQAAFPRVYSTGRFMQIEQVDAPDTEGWSTMRLLFQLQEEACGYVLSFGSEMEVIEPQEFREKVICLAQSVLACYKVEV